MAFYDNWDSVRDLRDDCESERQWRANLTPGRVVVTLVAWAVLFAAMSWAGWR